MTIAQFPSSSPRSAMAGERRILRVGYTPDSDDAFNFYAWEHGRVTLDGHDAVFERRHVIDLNNSARHGEHDVTNVSAVMYPLLADQYRILATGTSVGRGYGPVLVSSRFTDIAQLQGRRIAVGGYPTTGGVLAAMYCPRAQLVPMPYDHIATAILNDTVDAGVMIHEELVFFPSLGLRKVTCLGEMWCRETRLPLPVGLNIVHRRLGLDTSRAITRTCRASLEYGRAHMDEALAFAKGFGRGCARQFVEMFSNDDTLLMAADVRVALGLLLQRTVELGIGQRVANLEIIDG